VTSRYGSQPHNRRMSDRRPTRYPGRALGMLLVVFPLLIIAIAAFSADPMEIGPFWTRVMTVAVLLSVYGPLAGIALSVAHTYVMRRLNKARPATGILLGALLGIAVTSPVLLTLNAQATVPALIYGASAGTLYGMLVSFLERRFEMTHGTSI
jgi:prepilin signal peptidase PulO-like enzyme (type II secretory pathway)